MRDNVKQSYSILRDKFVACLGVPECQNFTHRRTGCPPLLGNPDFLGTREIWAKPVFKKVSIFFYFFEEIDIFYFNLKSATRQWLPST